MKPLLSSHHIKRSRMLKNKNNYTIKAKEYKYTKEERTMLQNRTSSEEKAVMMKVIIICSVRSQINYGHNFTSSLLICTRQQ